MKNKHFYSHMIAFERLSVELEGLDISTNEKTHLLDIAAANLHIRVLDVVLDHLPPSDKEAFLKHVGSDDHAKTWEFLRGRIESIEEKIIKASEELIAEFRNDIAGLKK